MKRSIKAGYWALGGILVCLAWIFVDGGTEASGGLFLPGQSASTGAVKGYVKDAGTGDALNKAKIAIADQRSASLKYELKTDKKGYYYKGGLRPGYYLFTVEKEGYLPTAQTVRVRLSDTVQADFALSALEAQVPETLKKAQKAMELFREEKWEEAVKDFSEGIAEDPTNPMLFFYRGIARENLGSVEEALSDYLKTIELSPEFTLPYSRAGKIYARQNEYEKAGQLYKKAVELGDRDITTLYNYGVVLMNTGKNTEARDVFENLLSLDEDYADAYYHLGIIHVGSGDTAQAKALLEKFLTLDPESRYASIAREILKSLKDNTGRAGWGSDLS
ncbi:MAG: tetratricopeptide repeat protein [Candidatus Aminicenantales bacterium]